MVEEAPLAAVASPVDDAGQRRDLSPVRRDLSPVRSAAATGEGVSEQSLSRAFKACAGLLLLMLSTLLATASPTRPLYRWHSPGDVVLGPAKRAPGLHADLVGTSRRGCEALADAMACEAREDQCWWNVASHLCSGSRESSAERARPWMGWSPWNAFKRKWDERLFIETADTMLKNGMRDAGYDTMFMDGGWWSGVDSGQAVRNKTGFLVEDRVRLPRGLRPLISDLHVRGFNYGHYTNAGKQACNRDKGLAYGHEKDDAAQFVAWGVDYLKIDSCGLSFVRASQLPGVVQRWRQALDDRGPKGRRVFINNCRIGCLANTGVGVKNGDDSAVCSDFPVPRHVAPWCQRSDAPQGMFRTSNDIRACWHSVMNNLDALVGIRRQPPHEASSRHVWVDPDYLEVGNEGLSLEESRSHFSLWCVTSSPLIAGNDVRTMPDNVRDILLNPLAIGVNQALALRSVLSKEEARFYYGGRILPRDESKRYAAASDFEVWYKPLPPHHVQGAAPRRRAAVVLLNRADTIISRSLSLRDLPTFATAKLPARFDVVDVWSGAESGVEGREDAPPELRAEIAGHGVAFFVVAES